MRLTQHNPGHVLDRGNALDKPGVLLLVSEESHQIPVVDGLVAALAFGHTKPDEGQEHVMETSRAPVRLGNAQG